jgi:hypothetical protein
MFHLLHFGFSFIFLILNVLVAVWVYNDAQKRADSNSVIWAIGTFFCCPIVPIIYLIVRK